VNDTYSVLLGVAVLPAIAARAEGLNLKVFRCDAEEKLLHSGASKFARRVTQLLLAALR
jgi:hypothetical protein